MGSQVLMRCQVGVKTHNRSDSFPPLLIGPVRLHTLAFQEVVLKLGWVQPTCDVDDLLTLIKLMERRGDRIIL